ncbi:RHS repeat-associated core domain-containing protein [Kosakonia sacchari]|uniref:Insecticidal toxin complex protein TccC n=1 Tax=Kosakonia sacchari TaxID=1158459 RepID=A0A1G4Y898_9ENTR|nr:RHS repeat-associated core domain-containing protein [Kosakonia sacchari]AHJ75198.2 hypothetical protein C813_11015 [Kosakonia sacchari SP1]SCX49625.1 insecticidal toxin complex protein TccC [Kosakonia sacchari]
MGNIFTSAYEKTPHLTVIDNRNQPVRTIQYYRSPDTLNETDERITYMRFNARSHLTESTDPRLFALQKNDTTTKANTTWITSLIGDVLSIDSVDAGRAVALNDCAGRPAFNISTEGLIRTWQYEDASLPGRLLTITEQAPNEQARITERFIWAGNSQAETNQNLAGRCVRHFDTAGLIQTNQFALTGVALSTSRRLLAGEVDADWQTDDQQQLSQEEFFTHTLPDATGTIVAMTDAVGNQQLQTYDRTGQLKGCWLTLTDGSTQTIIAAVVYSANGQKLSEEHGNGVVTTYLYEPETQRLIGIKAERPPGHVKGALLLQDLRYEYDPVGNIIRATNNAEATRYWRNQQVVPENSYRYDSLYQLINTTGREMANAAQQTSALPDFSTFDNATYTQYTRRYTYDRAGNLTKIQHTAPASGNNYTTLLTVSDRSNRAVLDSLTENPSQVDEYFTAGGCQKQLLPGQPLTWTARGELQKVTLIARSDEADDDERYRYDASGQRILKILTQKTSGIMQTQRVIYLPGLELHSNNTEIRHVITVGFAGTTQARVLHWENTQPSGISNNQVRYSYNNLIDSSALEVDSTGELISQEEFYPYGGTAIFAARSQLEADYKTLRYSGKERDATGLYYYGHRYYQPWAGRWLSTDPQGVIDGLNLYRMCRNNPISYFDDSGGESIPLVIHFAWEGKNIPTEALSNILFIKDFNPEFEVNIWTSRPMSIHATLDKMQHSETSAYEKYLARNYAQTINIQDTGTLYADLQKNHPQAKRLEALYHREISGVYRNYAAASDITRAALMFEKGGIYMDTDVIPANDLDTLAEVIGGAEHEGFLHAKTPKGTSNAVLASIRHSKKSSEFLEAIIKSTEALESIRPQASWTTKRSLMDENALIGRLKGTMMTTGPSVLAQLKLAGNQANMIPESIFFRRNATNTPLQKDELTSEQSLSDVVFRGLVPGFDARGVWAKARRLRRDSI